jgi:hypothetical protein
MGMPRNTRPFKSISWGFGVLLSGLVGVLLSDPIISFQIGTKRPILHAN